AAMGLDTIDAAKRRFEAGGRCFAAWVGGKIAAYGWGSWGGECIGELQRSFHIQPDEAYIWDFATLPPSRRPGLYRGLLSPIVMALRNQGMRRVWIGASLQNRPSIRGFAAAGFHPAIRLTYLRVLRARIVHVSDEPDAPPGLAAEARRALTESRGAGTSSVAAPGVAARGVAAPGVAAPGVAAPGATSVYSGAAAEEKCL